MQTVHNTKAALAVVFLAALVSALFVAGGAHAGRGGNAENAKLCQKGGWQALMDSAAVPFASEDACVDAGAHGGAIYALATLDVELCQDQPFDGICVGTSGSGLEPGSSVATRLQKNGIDLKTSFLTVLGDGSASSSPLGHFEIPCVAGNVYSASATGTSADSLSLPTAPGITITSDTVERTSTCL
jgi:hypothetical protein